MKFVAAHPAALKLEPPAKACSSDCGNGVGRPGPATDSAEAVDPTQSVPEVLPSAKQDPSPTATSQPTSPAVLPVEKKKQSHAQPTVVATPTATVSNSPSSRTRDNEVAEPQPDVTPSESETDGTTESQEQGEVTAAGASHVTVEFRVLSDSGDRYSARLVVQNDGSDALTGVTVEIPVSGEVTMASVPDWSQRDDGTLVLTIDDLDGGDMTVIRFRASGSSSVPGTCTLSTGECAVA
ncbi:hypothetical protein J5X84_09515 [Streptosporangiaceae bacterium NEAU-GS5]|nr:hypothetical protein [Streptosporangiaceae bacterium NEAU-GS5]